MIVERQLSIKLGSLTYWKKFSRRIFINKRTKKVIKGVWGMPRLSEAKKDVISCDKLRGRANTY
jgi:hypothetical protein